MLWFCIVVVQICDAENQFYFIFGLYLKNVTQYSRDVTSQSQLQI